MWDYAALSQAAKLEGGPEALVNHLLTQGISKGKVSMIPWLFVTFGVGGAVTFGITKGIEHLKKKQEEQLRKTKEELINGIKEYEEQQNNRKEEDYATVS